MNIVFCPLCSSKVEVTTTTVFQTCSECFGKFEISETKRKKRKKVGWVLKAPRGRYVKVKTVEHEVEFDDVFDPYGKTARGYAYP